MFYKFVIYLLCQIHLFPSNNCCWFITSAGILVLVWLHLNLFSFAPSITARNTLGVNCHQLSLYNVAIMIHDAGYWQNNHGAREVIIITQRFPSKFHSKYLVHTFKTMYFTLRWKFKMFYIRASKHVVSDQDKISEHYFIFIAKIPKALNIIVTLYTVYWNNIYLNLDQNCYTTRLYKSNNQLIQSNFERWLSWSSYNDPNMTYKLLHSLCKCRPNSNFNFHSKNGHWSGE